MNKDTLKEKFLDSIDLWLEGRVDDMLKGNPSLSIPAVYIKRGCHNILHKYKENIGESIDKAALFLGDENGNIDASTLFTDVIALLKGMEETPFDIGLMKGTIGKGKVCISLPDNVLLNLILGNKRTLTFGEDDFLELKSLLMES